MSGVLPEGSDIVIAVRDLWKIFRLGKTAVRALNGVSFDVLRGEFLAIVGTSGSGKSTLLNMLAGLEAPTKGKVFIHQRDITRMDEQQLVGFRKEHIGFIFQSFNLIASQTAEENVELPLVFRGERKSLRKRKARRMLHFVGLEKRLRNRPYEMSGGEQQRVGIARALVVQPEIVFADEPTGNLDSRTTDEILRLLQRISKEQNQTLVMVTHDNNLAQYADRIFRIVDGRIVAIEEGQKRMDRQLLN
ncbi:MAG: ABC transporter ATP-binding protein [Eubacteriales bacterium]|nr:ABC transporter ATP-binding protein [Eubacteriales bacterium]